ncbi:MAG: DUF5615 family PIN-like protein [Patescibacteria group bacterium]
MRFLVDENVRNEVARFLSKFGDAVHVSKGASDATIMEVCEKEWRILITHDKDFVNTVAYPPKKYAGIVLIRIHPPKPEVIIGALSNLFASHDEDALDGRLVILTEHGFLIAPTPGDVM